MGQEVNSLSSFNSVVTIHFRSDPEEDLDIILYLELKLNDQRVIVVYAEHGSTGTASVSLRLTAGDRLWLSQTKSSSSPSVESATMFSVVRVTPL